MVASSKQTKQSSSFYLALSTVGSKPEAIRIARALLDLKQAACVNIVKDVTSLFWWKGSIEKTKELLLVIKTEKQNLKTVEAIIRKHHSYEVPEIIHLRISGGFAPYLDWIKQSVKSSTGKRRRKS